MAGERKRNRWDSDSDSDSDGRGRHRAEGKRPRSSRTESRVSQSLAVARQEEEEEAAYVERPLVHNFYLLGCRSVDNYARIGKIDEGTYGVVSKARDKVTGEIVALKQVKMSQEVCHEGFPVTALRETNALLALDHPNIVKMSQEVCHEGFPVTALRETNALLALDHPNIVKVREMVVGSTPDKIFMVMDYAENDLKAVMETKMKQPFLQSEVKYLLKSLLSAIAYMHERWYIHRDLKTSNLLYDSKGVLKVCDFGLARKYGSPVRTYTQLVVTLWYRAPELLLGASEYSTAVDMWSVGCIFAEIILMKPLFPGRGEIDQMDQIFRLLGCPNDESWPGYLELPAAQKMQWKWPKTSRLRDKFPLATSYAGSSSALSNAGFDLLSKLLTFDPRRRISAKDALKHPYFKESPPPKSQAMMPTFPSSS